MVALKSAVALDEEDANLHFRLGYALCGMNRFTEAAEQIERAIEQFKIQPDLLPANPKITYRH